MPDHLEASLRALERDNSDLVYSAVLRVRAPGDSFIEYSPNGRDDTRAGAPASCWLFKRELPQQAGGWWHHRRCYGAPSMQWLHRVRQMGFRVTPHPALSAVSLPSGYRHGCYAARASEEHRLLYCALASDPVAFRQRAWAHSTRHPRHRMGGNALSRGFIFCIYRLFDLASKLGLRIPEPPCTYLDMVRHPGRLTKGGLIRKLQHIRGLTT
jgi:hypothetical protein